MIVENRIYVTVKEYSQSGGGGGGSTPLVVVDDQGTESVSGDKANQQEVNRDLTLNIKNIQTLLPTDSDVLNADSGDKLVLNEDKTKLILQASTTSSGFYDFDESTISFDPITNTFSITSVDLDYKFVTASGIKHTKASDSIVVPPYDGITYIYYDDDGILNYQEGLSRSQIYEIMQRTLPVSFISYSSLFGAVIFVGDYRKGRVSTGLWVKNFFDISIRKISGLELTGLTGGSGDADNDARFQLGAGDLIFADRIYDSPVRSYTTPWNIGFFDASGLTTGVIGNDFPVLTDIDLGVGSTGRLAYNNDGNPATVSNNDFVWYFVAITTDIEAEDRTLMFMGNNDYGTANQARNSLENEIAAVESSLNIKQGLTLQYAILYQTQDNDTNAVKAHIVEAQEINKEGSFASDIPSIPDELVNGSDASQLHNHDSLYLAKTSNINQMWAGTQAEYDAIDPKDDTTLYFIHDD